MPDEPTRHLLPLSTDPTRQLQPSGNEPTRRLPALGTDGLAECPHCNTNLEWGELHCLVPQPGRIFPAYLKYERRICPRCGYRLPVGEPVPSHWEKGAALVAQALQGGSAITSAGFRSIVQYLCEIQAADEEALQIWQGRPSNKRDASPRQARTLLEQMDRPYIPAEVFRIDFSQVAGAFGEAADTTEDPFRCALSQFYQGLCLALSGASGAARPALENAYRSAGNALPFCRARVIQEGRLKELGILVDREMERLRSQQRFEYRRRCRPVLALLQAVESLATQVPDLGLTLESELAPEVGPWLDPLEEE